MMVFMEGILMCFLLLLSCVIGMKNGPIGLVCLYEKDVQDRVVELGYTTKERIKRNYTILGIALFVPSLFGVPFMVYYINGASGLLDGFIQMTIIYLIYGLFDRLFIDWYWVGKTKAWEIPNTNDLKPYIPIKVVIKKWFGTLVAFPLYALLVAWIMTII